MFALSTRLCATSPDNYGWTFERTKGNGHRDKRVRALPLKSINRPLKKTRANDPKKVEALMKSIAEIGLQEPIDVLEVEGMYYGFSGCHRFEACERLNMETIDCRVRQATRTTLRMHLM